MKRTALYIFLLILALFTACQNDPFDFYPTDHSSQVTFGVIVSDGYSQSAIQTRGTPQSGTTAYETDKITVHAFDQTSDEDSKKDFNIVLSKSGTAWIYTPEKSYDGLTYNFYTYASDLKPITTTVNENGLSISSTTTETAVISYTVPDSVNKQPDLLIGDSIMRKTAGRVSLNLHHALSCVGFVASSKHVGNTRKVKSVKITHIYKSGTTPIAKNPAETIKWTTSGTPTGVSLKAGMNATSLKESYDAASANLTYLMQGNGYLMMVPQTIPEGAQIEMEIWDGTNDSSIHLITYDIPPTTWEPGKKYMYYFEEPILEGLATYYERYVDGSYGFYYYDGREGFTGSIANTLKDAATSPLIADAGYGLLVPAFTYTQYPSIYLGLANGTDESKDRSTSNGSVVAQLNAFTGVPLDCVLYPLSQSNYPYKRSSTSRRGFQPTFSDTPTKIEAGVSETGTGKPVNTHGYFLPHYAKGIYTDATPIMNYAIRTPIQMRNISYQTGGNTGAGKTGGKIYVQEFGTLDFSIHSGRTIYGVDVQGGVAYKESIVIGGFGGTFAGSHSPGGKAILAGLIISLPKEHKYNTALFEWVTPEGELNNIETATSCVYTSKSDSAIYIAGIAAQNSGIIESVTNRTSISNNPTTPSVTGNDAYGNTKIGGVVGLNARLVKNCQNYGVINNQSNHTRSTTGGIAAVNERYYVAWSGMSKASKDAFRYLQSNDYSAGNDATYPGAIISSCQNHARVVGAACTGGIAAYNNYGGVVHTSTNYAEVRNNGKCTTWVLLGGIVGLQQCGEVNNSVSDPPQFFSTIQECVNKGNVTATSGLFGSENLAVGGIVGNNDFARADGTLDIAAYGKVNRCVVDGVTVSGYFGDTGGIAGLNTGNVNRSLCTQVYVGGTFGQSSVLELRNSAGGIVGTNNNYVGSCLFVHSSPTTPISEAPVWNNSSSSGGIVGINNTNAPDLKSSSGYVQKCVFSAQAPKNVPFGTEVGTFAPIAGYTGGYLYRKWDGTPHMKNATEVDATTGATPLYTLDDNYYGSGTGINFTNQNIVFPNEPEAEVFHFGPFTAGRYPYGQTRFKEEGKMIVPVTGWFNLNGNLTWKSDSRPPVPNGLPVGYASFSYVLPSSGGAVYILEALISEVKRVNESGGGVVSFAPNGLMIASTVRVSLNYMGNDDLKNVTAITCNLSGVTYLPNNAGGEGALFFRAPPGWKFDASQTNPKPYQMIVLNDAGTEKLRYWYCLATSATGRQIKMVKIN